MDTRMRNRARGRRVGLCLLIGLAGCVSLGRREPLQTYFVLGGDPLRETPSPEVADVTVGVRRLKLASYLASPFMVVRNGTNQVRFSEFRRWGEPLGAGINRVVAGALLARGFRDVAVAPWPARGRYEYLVQLDVARFEGRAPEDPGATEGGVHLMATWEIIGQQDGVVLARGTTDYQRPGWTVGDFPGLVTMLNDGLEVLSAELTTGVVELRRLSSTGPAGDGKLRD